MFQLRFFSLKGWFVAFGLDVAAVMMLVADDVVCCGRLGGILSSSTSTLDFLLYCTTIFFNFEKILKIF